MRARFRPAERLRRRPEFQRVYREGTRISGRFMTLMALPNSLGISRLGVAATRKLGGAVRRNRAKRLIREIFRLNKPQHAVDLVVMVRPELFGASLDALEAEYRAMLGRIRRRIGPHPPLDARDGPGRHRSL